MSLRAVRRLPSPSGRTLGTSYLVVAVAGNLAWEAAQLPLYMIWRTAPRSELAYAVIHCTAGDFIILVVALVLALLLAGDAEWPARSYCRVAIVATLLGVGYTILSEWQNVEIFRRWAYAPAMPLLPPLGTGLAPLSQWLLIPPLSLLAAANLQRRSTPLPRG